MLIVFARHYVSMQDLAKQIRIAAAKDDIEGGKKSGLYCQANTIQKRAHKLKEIILEDRRSLTHFFNTANLSVIATKQIKL
jgi:hypothetical protein